MLIHAASGNGGGIGVFLTNGFIYFARGGEIASNRVDDQEVAMLCLHLLQISLVYINTLMIQQVVGEPEWQNRLLAADLQGLTPLVYTHINPYGTFRLDKDSQLPIEPHPPWDPVCSSPCMTNDHCPW